MRARRSIVPWLLAALALPALAGDDGARDAPVDTVRLPLAEYRALRDRIAEIEKRRAEPVEPPSTQLALQTTRIDVATPERARLTTRFEVDVRGMPAAPLDLPVSGLIDSAVIEPEGGAVLHRRGGSITLAARRPGRYVVTLTSVLALSEHDGDRRLELAASAAPVATAEVELPEELAWHVERAIVVRDEARGGRRHIELAPARDQSPLLELRRRLGHDQERLLARTAVVTVIETAAQRIRRQDIVRYEVLRGGLDAMEVTLPAGAAAERVATDEGDAVPVVEEDGLRVVRRQRLTGTGHLTLSFPAQPIDRDRPLDLAAVAPRFAVAERYLVTVSSRAADVEPLPAEVWQRADLDDLPGDLGGLLEVLRPDAVWRLAQPAAQVSLAVAPYPPAEPIGTVVWRRRTTTLLTLDGSLVHQDRFDLRQAASSFAIALPASAVLWSATVDGVAVRPIAQDGRVVVPLAFHRGGETEVDLVAVEERAIPPGRSELHLAAPRVETPVLAHEWRILLPDDHRYRYAGGDLTPAPPTLEPRIVLGGASRDGATGAVLGKVTDRERAPLPGVTVSLVGTGLATLTDADGRFGLPAAPPGSYPLRAELEGFNTVEYPVRIVAGRATTAEVELSLGFAEELVVITPEAGVAGAGRSQRLLKEWDEEQARQGFDDSLEVLEEGLQQGVRPLVVDLPESGKLLFLTGALPPPEVAVEIQARRNR